MARYYRYRKYSRRFRRKNWSSRITNLDITQSVAGGQTFQVYRTLATNPAQSEDSVSNKFTIKNIKCNFIIEAGDNGQYLENLQAFVLFVPQGFTFNASTPYEHPEWIMASKHIGVALAANNPGYSPLYMSTRLARKLDTGDRIVFVVQGVNTYQTQSASARLTGIIRYNTKAN